MSRLYDKNHRRLQAEFATTGLADAVETATLRDEINDEDAAFIHARDMFFLSTVNESGQPTVSYKGGDPEFVKVVNPTTLVFPSYDGNGMFMSMGNLDATGLVGMLFIDFESPARRRVQGKASLHRQHPLLATYPEAQLLVEVVVTELWVNCPRYIHRYEKVSKAEHVPREGVQTPLALWKRLEQLQPMLTEADQARARKAGYITAEEYEAAQ